MKNGIISYTALVAFAILLPSTAVFAQTQEGQKPTTIVSLAELKSQLSSLQSMISSTIASLERVKSAGESGPVGKASADFTTRLKGLDSQVELIRRYAVTVKARAKDHYETWQKEISTVQNPKIREKAQERFAEARKQFDKIISTAGDTKQQLGPFLTDLKDVGIYLEADSSQDAVKSLSSTIWKLGNKSKTVLGSINDLNEQIQKTIQTMPKSS